MDILIILLHHGYTNYIIILHLYGGGHCNNNESPSPQKTTTRIPPTNYQHHTKKYPTPSQPLTPQKQQQTTKRSDTHSPRADGWSFRSLHFYGFFFFFGRRCFNFQVTKKI